MKRKINSRAKGARGERAWRDVLRANGFMARRGQQFCGSPDSPDVICEALACLHWEVKNVEKLNIWDALDQARRDAGPSALGVVAFTRNNWPFYVAMRDEIFFRILQHTDLEGLARSLEGDGADGLGTQEIRKEPETVERCMLQVGGSEPLTRPPATLSPSDGEREGRGATCNPPTALSPQLSTLNPQHAISLQPTASLSVN
jgi:Holliday junction resolvase